MTRIEFFLALVLGLLLALSVALGQPPSSQQWTMQAASPDARTAQPAIAALRAQGPDGLAALLRAHDEQIQHFAGSDSDNPQWQRLRSAIDAVAAQRDAYASRLYWYTDVDQAKVEARRQGKPILSLRLLGTLDTELSCANSRFFRTTLYPDPQIGKLLREQFVLHWQSVRPVPVVTIDFGDGRSIRRTITGNSIHYVLDADGRVLDAIPGLYGPQAFHRALSDALELSGRLAKLEDSARSSTVKQWNGQQANDALRKWSSDLSSITGRSSPELTLAALRDATDERAWNLIAARNNGDALLSDEAAQLVERKSAPPAREAARIAVAKRVAEAPLLRLVDNLQHSIALDSVRNEYLLHTQIHEWLCAGDVERVDALNERVYAELFLTPSSDPWLGLAPADAYSAIEGEGMTLKP